RRAGRRRSWRDARPGGNRGSDDGERRPSVGVLHLQRRDLSVRRQVLAICEQRPPAAAESTERDHSIGVSRVGERVGNRTGGRLHRDEPVGLSTLVIAIAVLLAANLSAGDQPTGGSAPARGNPAETSRALVWAGDPEGGAPFVEADPSDPGKVVG